MSVLNKGGGRSYLFNELINTAEIRTPIYTQGIGSFTLSFWLKNLGTSTDGAYNVPQHKKG